MKMWQFVSTILLAPIILGALQEGVTEFYDEDGSPIHMIVSGSVLVTDELPVRSSRSNIPRILGGVSSNRHTEKASKRHLHQYHKKRHHSSFYQRDDVNEPTVIIVNKRDHDNVLNRHKHHHHQQHHSKNKSVVGAVRDVIPAVKALKAVKAVKKTLYPPPSNLWQINEELAQTEEGLRESGRLLGYVNPLDQITFDAPAVDTKYSEVMEGNDLHPEEEDSDESSKFRTRETVRKAIPGISEHVKKLNAPTVMSMKYSGLKSHNGQLATRNINVEPPSPDIAILDPSIMEKQLQAETKNIEKEKNIKTASTEQEKQIETSKMENEFHSDASTEVRKHEQAVLPDTPHESPRPYYRKATKQETSTLSEKQHFQEPHESPRPFYSEKKEEETHKAPEQQQSKETEKTQKQQSEKQTEKEAAHQEADQSQTQQLQQPSELQESDKELPKEYLETPKLHESKSASKPPVKAADISPNKDEQQSEEEKEKDHVALNKYMQALSNKMREIKKLKNVSEDLLNVPKPVSHTKQNLEDERSYANSFQEKFLKLYSPAQIDDAKAEAEQKKKQEEKKVKPEAKKNQASVKDGGVLLNGNEPTTDFRPRVKALVVQTKLNTVNFDDTEAKAKASESKAQQMSAKEQGNIQGIQNSVQQHPTRKIPQDEIQNPAGFAPKSDLDGKAESQPSYLASFKQELSKNIEKKLGKIAQDDAQKAKQEDVDQQRESKVSFTNFSQQQELQGNKVDKVKDNHQVTETNISPQTAEQEPSEANFGQKASEQKASEAKFGQMGEEGAVQINYLQQAGEQKQNDESTERTTKEELERQALEIQAALKQKLAKQAHMQNVQSPKEHLDEKPEDNKSKKHKAQQKHQMNVVYPSPNFNEFHPTVHLSTNQSENDNLMRFTNKAKEARSNDSSDMSQEQVPELVKLTQKLKLSSDDDTPDVIDNQNEKLVSARKNPDDDQITITADPTEQENEVHHYQKPSPVGGDQPVKKPAAFVQNGVPIMMKQVPQASLALQRPEEVSQEAILPKLKPDPIRSPEEKTAADSFVKQKTMLLADPNVKLPLKQSDVNRIKAAQYILNKNKNAYKMLTKPVQVQVPVDFLPLQVENIENKAQNAIQDPAPIEAATNHQENLLSDAKDQQAPPQSDEPSEDISNLDAASAVKIMTNEQSSELPKDESSMQTQTAPIHPDAKEKTVFGETLTQVPRQSKTNAIQYKSHPAQHYHSSVMPTGGNPHAPYSRGISSGTTLTNVQSERIAAEPEVWPAGVNPGALLSFQMTNQDRIIPEKGNLRGRIHATSDQMQTFKSYGQRSANNKYPQYMYPAQRTSLKEKVKIAPIKQNSVMSLIKPRIPTGPSIAYNQMLPPVARGVYTYSKSKSQAKTSASSAASSSSQTNTGAEKFNKAKSQDENAANARHHGRKPGPNYGYGSGSGYGYGKTSYGWGGGGGWAGQAPPKGMPLPGYPSGVPPQIPGFPNAGSAGGAYPGQGGAASQPAQQQPMRQNHQSSVAVGPASSSPSFANNKAPVKPKQNKINGKTSKPLVNNKPNKVIKTTNFKTMQQKAQSMKKIQNERKYEKLKTVKQVQPIVNKKSKPRYRAGGPKSILPDEYDK